jgi:hypothetical protein
MNISREDAAAALASVESADRRMETLRGYHNIAPYLLLWGAVWFVANIVEDRWPARGPAAWLTGILIGCAGTAVVVVTQARSRTRLGLTSPERRRQRSLGFGLLGVTVLAYFLAMGTVLGPLDARQANAFISLFWAITYMAVGSWLGLRLFLTGLIAVIAIVAGYLYIHEHFSLWMAVCGGGSLMLGGLWLRRP